MGSDQNGIIPEKVEPIPVRDGQGNIVRIPTYEDGLREAFMAACDFGPQGS